MNSELTSWERLEFQAIDFGDKRLDKRFNLTVKRLSEQPMAPINQACSGWSDTKAAYRLFDNPKVTAEKILLPHQQCTLERIKAEKLILAVQDTTYLNYDKHKAKTGLGCIGVDKNKEYQGLIMHNTLAITPEGLCLGFIDQQIYARTRSKKAISNKQLPFEEKESYRWYEAMQATHQAETGDTRVITLGDRESDIYEVFHFGQASDSEFVIRAAWDRRLHQGHSSTKQYLWGHMEKQPVLGTLEIEVPTDEGTIRTASVSLRAGRIGLGCPERKGGRLGDVELYAVWLNESRAPKGATRIEWMLLTNIPCVSLEDVIEKINWYKTRWQIEIYHKILKSGCRVEHCRLEDASRLLPYLTVMSIIAWRLHWMTYMNRVVPDGPCSMVFEAYEWKALYIKVNKTKDLPVTEPTVTQAIRWMAKLGGFLGRQQDGEPGIVAIWRGWQRLHDIAEDYLLFQGNNCG